MNPGELPDKIEDRESLRRVPPGDKDSLSSILSGSSPGFITLTGYFLAGLAQVAMHILRHSKIAVRTEIYTEAPSDVTL